MSTGQAVAAAGPRRPRRRLRPLHPWVCWAGLLGALAGLYPTPLPRTGWVAGLVVALCVGVSTTLALITARVARAHSRPRAGGGHVAKVAAAITLPLAALGNLWWQNGIRSELDYPPVGIGWFVTLVVPALLVFGLLAWAPRITGVATAMIVALGAGYVPASAGSTAAQSPRAPSSVLYAALGDARVDPTEGDRSLAARADELVRRWIEAGGLDQRAVVLAVPTGSGWVDPAAVSAIDERFDGRARVLALQYADISSWRAFVGDREAAGRSTIAVLRRVIDAVQHDRTRREPTRRHRSATSGPDAATAEPAPPVSVYLYGQSLGALGADRARAWADARYPGAITGTLLAGVPADAIPRSAAGTPRIVVANDSDPVARWSTALVWRPAQRPIETRTIGHPARSVPWLPVISFVQSTADLLGSLGGPTGVGHRYGREQGLLPDRVAAPGQLPPIGPRAAS